MRLAVLSERRALSDCVPTRAELRHASSDHVHKSDMAKRSELELGHTGRSMVAIWIHHLVSILGSIVLGGHWLAHGFGILGCVPKRRIHCSKWLQRYSEKRQPIPKNG